MKKKLYLILMLVSVIFLMVACNNQQPTQPQYQLVVSVEGQGTVSPNSGTFQLGTSLTLQVQPASGWKFSAWGGQNYQELVRTGDSWRLMMNGDKFLTAIFVQDGGGTPGLRQLQVDVLGSGNVVPNGGSFADGTNVSLQVLPANGWVFSQWSGLNGSEVMPAGSNWTIRMDGDKRIAAVFSEKQSSGYTLNIDIVGQGTVEEKVISSSNQYPANSVVRLLAKPSEGWVFQGWQGDARGDEVVVYLDMNSDKSVKAVFVTKDYNLDIKIIGEGTVNESLIAGEYPYNSIVKLTARAAYGWEFVEWRGHATGRKAEVYVEIDGDKQVTAVFEAKEVHLDIEIIGKGKVEQKLISDVYDPDSIVQLTAIPAKNWEFAEWRGDARGRKEVIEIDMDSDKEVIAVFEEKQDFDITINITGNGRVEEKLIKDYPYGSIVQLTALADDGWKFVEWRGDASGTKAEVELEMDEDKEVEAVFEEKPEGTAEVSGQITMTHLWPHPHHNKNYSIGTPHQDTGKLPVLEYAKVRNAPQGKDQCVPGRLIVGFKQGFLLADEEISILSQVGLEPITSLNCLNAHLVEVDTVVDDISARAEAQRVKEELMSISTSIAYVEPDFYVYMLSNATNYKIPNDPMYKQQWHYPQVRLPQAWTVTTGSKDVRVAILDTGIAAAHPDLQANVDTSDGWNFCDDNADTTDRQQHGSHCAGTVGATTNNNVGVSGIMWEATIIPIKVLNDQGSGTTSGVAAGIMYVAGIGDKNISKPAHVISMSLGGSSNSEILENACNAAEAAGVIIVAASGNSNGPVDYPGGCKSTICIGATNYNYPNAPQRARYSSYGPEMDIVAPGGDVYQDSDKDGYGDGVLSTTFKERRPTDYSYEYFNGTSMATPHAAGIVGLMLANGVPASEVRETLRRTAIDLGEPGFDNQFGYGLANTYWAINNVKEIKIVVGTRNGNTIDAVAEGTVDLASKTYTLSKIPSGSYKVFGWVDVQGTDTIDPGDYLFESQEINFSDNDRQTVNMNLNEVQ